MWNSSFHIRNIMFHLWNVWKPSCSHKWPKYDLFGHMWLRCVFFTQYKSHGIWSFRYVGPKTDAGLIICIIWPQSEQSVQFRRLSSLAWTVLPWESYKDALTDVGLVKSNPSHPEIWMKSVSVKPFTTTSLHSWLPLTSTHTSVQQPLFHKQP